MQLWHVLGATILVKVLALGAGVTFLGSKHWVGRLQELLRSWHDVMIAGQAGQWPRIDYGHAQPALAGAFYAWLGTFLDADSAALGAYHAALMLVVELINISLFWHLARSLNRDAALPATLCFALSASSLVFSPVTDVQLVLLTLLAGYHYQRRGRPLAAAAAWSLGACLHPFPWLVICAQAMHLARTGRPPAAARWLAPCLALGLWVAVQLGFAWLCWERTHGLNAWITIARVAAETTPGSFVAIIPRWLAGPDVALAARLLTVGLVVAMLWLPPRRGPDALARGIAAVGLAAVLLDRAYPPEWNLCVAPFALLGVLASRRSRLQWCFALWLVFDFCHVRGYPFGSSAAIVLRTLLGFALLRELYGSPESEATSAWLEPPGPLTRARALLAHKGTAIALAAALIAAQSVWFSEATIKLPVYSDERWHATQVDMFCVGDMTLIPQLTMIPGYHAFAALVAKASADCSLASLRMLQVLLSAAATWLAGTALLAVHSRNVVARTLQFHFLPLIFPYYFLVYTDVLSLLLTALCLSCMLRGRFVVAAIAAALAVGVRQTNIVLVLLIGLVALFENDQFLGPPAILRAYLSKVWLAALVLAAFALFVWQNEGVALGDRDRHQLGFHVENVYFGLACWFFLSLPSNVERLWQQRRELSKHGFWLALFVAYAIYMLYFHADHRYNHIKHFLRNDVLSWLQHDVFAKSLFFIPVALGFATLWTTSLARNAYWAIFVVALLVLIPEQLVETRYILLPVAVWMLVRRDGSRTAEYASAFSNAALSIWLVHEVTLGGRL